MYMYLFISEMCSFVRVAFVFVVSCAYFVVCVRMAYLFFVVCVIFIGSFLVFVVVVRCSCVYNCVSCVCFC